ncbi:MAG TPA: chorismate mutase [Gaiellaceae bacterium]|nr:chorismate mutase [Gaiellaceae bacterium]
MTDPVVDQIREQITDTDRALIEALNKRIKLVQQLWRYKERHGLPLHDPAREEWMLSYLSRANRGPLSTDGLAEIYAQILDLTKRETAQPAEA